MRIPRPTKINFTIEKSEFKRALKFFKLQNFISCSKDDFKKNEDNGMFVLTTGGGTKLSLYNLAHWQIDFLKSIRYFNGPKEWEDQRFIEAKTGIIQKIPRKNAKNKRLTVEPKSMLHLRKNQVIKEWLDNDEERDDHLAVHTLKAQLIRIEEEEKEDHGKEEDEEEDEEPPRKKFIKFDGELQIKNLAVRLSKLPQDSFRRVVNEVSALHDRNYWEDNKQEMDINKRILMVQHTQTPDKLIPRKQDRKKGTNIHCHHAFENDQKNAGKSGNSTKRKVEGVTSIKRNFR